MIYPETFEDKLGFGQIRQKLKGYCLSAAGAAWVDDMRFSREVEEIRTQLQQNLEFRQILEKSEAFPSRYFFDPTDWLQKIALEGNWLEADEFLNLAYSLETVMAARQFLSKAQDIYRELYRLAQPVMVTGTLVQAVTSRIDDKALVRDSASPELGRLRKRLREEQGRLRKLADQIYRTAVEQKWVPEGALPTIREGRVVIPIQAEHKRKLKGFILDESATGHTVFLEPTEMLDANNEIRDLEHAEKREVVRVLRELTDEFRQQLPVLRVAYQFLSQIDFIRAKARFSVEIGADLPLLEKQPELVWYNARHPLLYLSLKGKRDIVPLNIELDRQDRMLLVSGPNAGGKSVCLKTVGLLQYMLQCGLLIPVSDRSRVGIFHDILLDIGDQQSIENDLSTYSSHLRNMDVFIRSASDKSLMLMDELGSGTDPDFGGAIAQAILEALLKKRVWGVATTHYYNLKLFAGQRQGIRNAAMRFDDQHLMPLYVLDIGKPGSSFALEIARKIGLPQETLQEAEKLVGKDLAGFEKLVRSLERERQELSERLKKTERQESDLRQSLAKYQTLSGELESRRKEIINKAKEEASGLLRDTNREIEKTIRHIRENQAHKRETQKVRKNLQDITQRVEPEVKQPQKRAPEELKEGDRVRIIGQDGSGRVLSIQGKNATVQFGELKSVTKIDKLEKITAAVEKEIVTRLRSVGLDVFQKRSTFNDTLDIRGKRVEEVMPLLDQFIDTAILLGQGELKILHGKGEGVLRKVVRDHLKRYKEVASMNDEHVERGGDGITVVVLK
ncbi:endonuclease MutS2 [Parachryseolinea silvisoli]|jgi:DNA mismatch repair protein MutS2|uniref:endonuclease MutS2 n=1 Tax=Parachryseolinea silvisoli TaxID=2873601 RepID=UPI0022657ECB|nr:endonuclease MutS2 [Parachryseolinea silvisoli]MCD9019040.1 endonuclease MutS2 [Parachryseolinea silvisoli]